MAELTVDQQKALALANARKRASQEVVYQGAILPFTEYADGRKEFDSDAGILGSLKRSVMLVDDAMTGKIDPRSDEAIRRSFEAAAFFSPMNPAVRSGGRAIPGVAGSGRKGKVATPTAEELQQTGGAAYDAVREMGVTFTSDSVKGLAGRMRADLEKDGILAALAPKTFKILKKLETPPENSVAELTGLEAARRALRNAAKDFNNPTEQLAAQRLIRGIDGFVEAPDPSAVVAGPAGAAGKLQAEARANIAAGKRSDKLNAIEEAADLQAGATYSGRNTDNAIRQRVVRILSSPKERAGYSPAELKFMELVAKGKGGRNTLRYVGNLLGGGGGLGSVVSGGFGGLAGGLFGAPLLGAAAGIGLPAVGFAAKSLANRATRKALQEADDFVRQRSPLYEQRAAEAPVTVPSLPARSAPIRAIEPAVAPTGLPPNPTYEQLQEYWRSGGA